MITLHINPRSVAQKVLSLIIAAVATTALMAAPARRQPATIQQPDGSTITIQLQGDEWHHWVTDLQGHLLTLDDRGCYQPASAADLEQWQIRHEQARLRRPERRTAAHRADANSTSSDSDSTFTSHFSFPTRGEVRGLVVLVEFQDVHFTIDENPLQQYTDMLNKPGYNYATLNSQGLPSTKFYHRGSARDFYIQNSNGLFTPAFDVVGPIPLAHDRAYYGQNKGSVGNDANPGAMLVEACNYLDSIGQDFSLYDANNDKVIDFIFAIYAGEGENAIDVSPDAVWPHAWDIPAATGQHYYYQGFELHDYACTCEEYAGHLDGVGTFLHEFTHVLGLPDVYNTNSSWESLTAGTYDLLDNGCYNLNGYCPCNLSAYERYELGWLQPEVLNEPRQYQLPATTNGPAYLLPITEGLDDPRDGEYYIFENRQLQGFDEGLEGHGMLAWHIDYNRSLWYNNKPNNVSDHLCIDLIEANAGTDQSFSGGFPFPGADSITLFTDDTLPALSGWTTPGKVSDHELGHRLDKPISFITESEQGEISFYFLIDPSAVPTLSADAPLSAPRIVIGPHGAPIIRTTHGDFSPLGQKL